MVTELQNEAYVQILKQISSHSNRENMLRGWNLLAVVASTFPPSKNLFYSLTNYLVTEIKLNPDIEIQRHANFVLARLNRVFLNGARNNIPCDKEINYIEVIYQ